MEFLEAITRQAEQIVERVDRKITVKISQHMAIAAVALAIIFPSLAVSLPFVGAAILLATNLSGYNLNLHLLLKM